MKKIIPYERNVYYYETDKMGIMHHSNYIRILEESRVSFLEQVGLPFREIEAQGLLVPVLEASCRYIRPLVFDEPFAVYPVITMFNGVRFSIDYKIVSRKNGELSAEGHSSHCFTDSNMKPIRIKQKYPAIYNAFSEHINYTVTEATDKLLEE